MRMLLRRSGDDFAGRKWQPPPHAFDNIVQNSSICSFAAASHGREDFHRMVRDGEELIVFPVAPVGELE